MLDVFGEIMKYVQEGKEALHIIERDDGFFSEDPGSWFNSPYPEWPDCQKNAMKFVHGKVLDIGCGMGRVSLYLQEQGFEIVSIDLSPLAIKLCKKQGLLDARVMSAAVLDFADSSFSTILLIGNGFGILGAPENVIDMLRDLHRITTDDAVILAETTDPEAWKQPQHVKYCTKNTEMGKPPGLWTMRTKYKELVGEWNDILFTSPELMNEIASEAGWFLDHYIGERSLYVGVLKKV